MNKQFRKGHGYSCLHPLRLHVAWNESSLFTCSLLVSCKESQISCLKSEDMCLFFYLIWVRKWPICMSWSSWADHVFPLPFTSRSDRSLDIKSGQSGWPCFSWLFLPRSEEALVTFLGLVGYSLLLLLSLTYFKLPVYTYLCFNLNFTFLSVEVSNKRFKVYV